jgi:hypothetical protein
VDANARHKLVRRKIERADEHISNLNETVSRFISSGPYKVATERNSDTGQLIYYVSQAMDTPPSFSAIKGDVLNNLRCSLDHLA